MKISKLSDMNKNQEYGIKTAKAIEDYFQKNLKKKIDWSKIKGIADPRIFKK